MYVNIGRQKGNKTMSIFIPKENGASTTVPFAKTKSTE